MKLNEVAKPDIGQPVGTPVKNDPDMWSGEWNWLNNQRTTLKGSPKKMDGKYIVSGNLMETLEGSPKKVYGSYTARNCLKLRSTKGISELVTHDLNLSFNPKLTTIEYMPTMCMDFVCVHTPLDMRCLRKWSSNTVIKGEFYFTLGEATNILNILMSPAIIVGVAPDGPKCDVVQKIINKYIRSALPGQRDIHSCQEEMIDAGVGEYAKI